MAVELAGCVGILKDAGGTVFFSKDAGAGTTYDKNASGTAAPIKELENALGIAPWGEDNCFPQHIARTMEYCSIAPAALDWSRRALMGNGIVPGKVVAENQDGTETFQPLDRNKYKPVYAFLNQSTMPRYWVESSQDWKWYFNNFEECILSADAKTITRLVHQESSDCRYGQMDSNGKINKVYLSKMWGMTDQQFVQFYPKFKKRNFISGATVNTDYIKTLSCIDMYNPVQSLKKIADTQFASQRYKGLKSAILPVNYPSVGKTYYQKPFWDGSRLSGWVEIASKSPEIIKAAIDRSFRIKYHIEIPDNYFKRKLGTEKWASMTPDGQKKEREDLMEQMNTFLTGSDNAFKTFVSFFEIDAIKKDEYARIKITPVEDKSTFDKEILGSSAANMEVLMAMQINPALFNSGATGGSTMYGNSAGSGSDIREAFLVYCALLKSERDLFLEPLRLVRDYNREVGGIEEWEPDIEFRIRDIQLTTLDTGAGTKKTLS